MEGGPNFGPHPPNQKPVGTVYIYLSYKMFSSDMYPSRVSIKYCFTTDRLELADLRIADA